MKKTLIASALFISTATFAADYQIDTGHSAVTFKIGHLGVSLTPGRFNEFEGKFRFDEKMSDVGAEIVVNTESVDTNHDARDKHLRSPDFLNVKQFPTMTFKSTAYADNKLTGNLTLNGQTKPVTFDLEKIGEGNDPWGGYRAGFVASTTINRSEFGITYFIPGVSDATEIEIFVEGIRQ